MCFVLSWTCWFQGVIKKCDCWQMKAEEMGQPRHQWYLYSTFLLIRHLATLLHLTPVTCFYLLDSSRAMGQSNFSLSFSSFLREASKQQATGSSIAGQQFSTKRKKLLCSGPHLSAVIQWCKFQEFLFLWQSSVWPFLADVCPSVGHKEEGCWRMGPPLLAFRTWVLV